jgi:acetyl-CoA C-acetyltransferase
MEVDPRAPVLVGAGQILQRSPAGATAGSSPDPSLLEPLELMERAARLAAEDAQCPDLLARLDSVRVPQGLWPYANPAHVLRDRLGAPGAQTATAPVSGNMVQRMLTNAAREIVAGRRDAVLIVGAEAEQSKRRAKRAGRELDWSEFEAPPPDLDFHSDEKWMLREEFEAGLAQPAAIFTLYENAMRHARGEGLDENRDRIARLWHGLAKVAESNPFAWTREAPSVEAIRDATPDNRMHSYPYTKRLCSNLVVDLGAAVILCSAELAQRLGIPRDRWVFLQTATDCMKTPPLSYRMDFLRVPALELAGRRALELAGREPADFAHLDFYSCFPAAVQVAAESLGFSLDRPLTVTGGLAYAGGPFNSYVLHSIATTMDRVRKDPGSLALVSSIGGAFSKHAFGIYSSEPAATGFQYADLDSEAEGLPTRELAPSHEGEALIESYALRYKDGEPSLATFACLLDDGRRTWAKSEATTVFDELLASEPCGRRARLKDNALVEL